MNKTNLEEFEYWLLSLTCGAQETNICISGGAEGADYAWEEAASQGNHHAVIMSFQGHKHQSASSKSRVIKLTPHELQQSMPWLKEANTYLKRANFDINLLKRNYYQVQSSDMVYAVATQESSKKEERSVGIEGGTAWACQMFLLRYLSNIADPGDSSFNLPMYLYDLKLKKWLRGNATFADGVFRSFQWKNAAAVPRPFGIYTGIGSRSLTDDGKRAITNLYRW